MWTTNLKIGALALAVILFYTGVAHIIPQLQSEVPEAMDLGTNVSPEQLVAAGEKIFNGAGGCTACHGLGTRAPNLLTDFNGAGPIGQRCAARFGDQCKDYLHTSLVKPQDSLVAGFGPIMPDMSRQLSNDQIWAAVAFLESQGGEVNVTGQDIQKTATSQPAAAGASGGTALAAGGSTDPHAIINALGCLACHELEGQGQQLGPPFDGMGARVQADEIRKKILDPRSITAKGYEKMVGLMPPGFGARMSGEQLEALVQFLASRK